MKKVVFSITNVRSKSDKKLSGFGFLTEGNLLCPCVSKNNKPYIRVFDDVKKRCRPVPNKTDEFQGYITMYFTEVPVYREKTGNYDVVDLESNTKFGTKPWRKTKMINLNEIAFIDSDGFDYNDGEKLIRFDIVAFYPDKKIITLAVTKQGQISVLDYEVFQDKNGHYIEYGYTYQKIYIDKAEVCK